MKRSREESYVGSQYKRTHGNSRRELIGQTPHPVALGGGGGQKPTTYDALRYLNEVKEMFRDQMENYMRFLALMKDFKAQRVDTVGVIARVKELFKGHNNLIYGFNTFLPKGFEITVAEVEEPVPKKGVDYEEALALVHKMKKRFQNDDHQIYKSFIDILLSYTKGQRSVGQVYVKVSKLLEDHLDLLKEFIRFLPNRPSSASAPHPQHGSNFQDCDERSSGVDKRWRSRDRFTISIRERDLSDEPLEREDRVLMKSHKDQRKRDKDNRDKRNSDVDDREAEHDNNRDFRAHKDEYFRALASSDDKDALKSKYSKEFIFCEKVKEKLDPVDYQSFLKYLHIYSKEIITRNDLQNFVADLLGKYPDLMEGFSEFVERCENIESLLNARQVKADEKDKGPKREIDPPKEKSNKEYTSKSIQELDLSNRERCSPSYRLLPADYPIPVASHRTNIGEEVLNDHWVSVTSGSEDYSFKHLRRNQYEESLFKCEDDRFELDMLLESASSTAKKVKDLLISINDSYDVDDPICLEDHFTPLNLRCIERLYGDHGLEVLDTLRRNPGVSLPIILSRLKQKLEEWAQCRVDYNKVWAELYSKNHFKSLDHRSFYFKQLDSKNLSIKSLVAEIKEIKENMQKEDDTLLAVAAGNKRPMVPHFKFEYIDNDIHEDLFKLIRFSCEEICSTKEDQNKVMKLWTTFLEPMLGISSHAHGVGSVEVGKAQQRPAGSRSARNPKLVVDGVENLTAVELAIGELKATGGIEGSTSSAQPKTLNDAVVADKALEPLPTSSASSQTFLESHHNESNMESLPGPRSTPLRTPSGSGAEDAQEPKFITDASAGMINGTLTQSSNSNRQLEEDVGPSNIDEEEGESSPNPDVDKEIDIKIEPSIENLQHQDVIAEDVGADNDAGDEDGENASEEGDDVLGSESAGDECSREEEDVEHDDLEGKAESEGEAEENDLSGDLGSLPSSEHSLVSVKPLAKYVSSTSRDADKEDSLVFYGNDTFYAVFRLHRMLYERLLTAKTNLTCPESKCGNSKDESRPVDNYARFKTALYHLLDGCYDNAKFEDDCRSIFGNQSYVLFTLDKLVYKLVKQLQVAATDEMENKLLQLYEYERSRKSEKFVDSVYHENARVVLLEDNVYRFESSFSPDRYRLSIQLMEDANEKPGTVAVLIEPYFAAYVFNDFVSLVSSRKEPRGLLLQRNKKKYAGLDEYTASVKAMEDVHLSNDLECKVVCSTSKIFYVLDTEDVFFRAKKARKNLSEDFSRKLNQARKLRFHRRFNSRFSPMQMNG